MINAFTVDLEPWMAFYEDVPQKMSLDRGELVKGTMRLLDTFDENDILTTFFVQGIVYEWFPDLIDEISSRNHEIAFHGYSHNGVTGDLLRSEIEKSKFLIEKYSVKGFRAPRMRIFQHDLELLSSTGFLYDSSIYGSFNRQTSISGLKEVPVSSYPVSIEQTFPRTFKDSLRNSEIPFGSGLFLGLLSSKILSSLIKKVNDKNRPVIMCIHPWQLTGIPKTYFRRLIADVFKLPYLLKVSQKRISELLKSHTFSTIRMLLDEQLADDFGEDSECQVVCRG